MAALISLENGIKLLELLMRDNPRNRADYDDRSRGYDQRRREEAIARIKLYHEEYEQHGCETELVCELYVRGLEVDGKKITDSRSDWKMGVMVDWSDDSDEETVYVCLKDYAWDRAENMHQILDELGIERVR
jgi:hypothetical protein